MKNLEKYIDNRNNYPNEFEKFKDMFRHTLEWEGGSKLHKVEGDSGGWTKYGIAYNKNSRLFTSLDDFFDTTYEESVLIAFSEYYLPIKANLVPLDAQLMYFDMAYNLGANRAIKYMQKCAGVKDDGKIGPITISKMGNVTEECLYEKRNTWYYYLANNTSWGRKFLKGWLNRSKSIKEK